MTGSNSHTCTAKEAMDKQQTSAANMEDMTPDPLCQQQQQQQGEEEKESGDIKSQDSIPPLSEGPEDGSSSSNKEGEPEAVPTNQSRISESTLTSVSQLNQPTTLVEPHAPSLHGDGYHGKDGLDLECGVGVEELSYWTISPCGSPDSGQTPHSLGPLINEV